jgi:hypothetical protein
MTRALLGGCNKGFWRSFFFRPVVLDEPHQDYYEENTLEGPENGTDLRIMVSIL